MAEARRPVPARLHRRGPVGQEGTAPALDIGLQGADPQHQAYELQAHRRLSGAGGQLGFRHGAHPFRRAAHPGAQPLCLHRRGLGGLRGGGSRRVPRGRGQGHGELGAGERGLLRPVRRAHPLDRGRLRQVRGAGDPPGPPVRCSHHGPPLLRPGSLRRDLEAGGEPLPFCGTGSRGALGRTPVFPH